MLLLTRALSRTIPLSVWELQSTVTQRLRHLECLQLALPSQKTNHSHLDRFGLVPPLNTFVILPKKKSTSWVSTKWKCSSCHKSTVKKLRNHLGSSSTASTRELDTVVRTPKRSSSINLAMPACQSPTTTWNTLNTEFITITLAQLISKWETTTTLLIHQKRHGPLTSKIWLTTQRCSSSTKRTTLPTTKWRKSSKTRTTWASKAKTQWLRNCQRIWAPGNKSTTTWNPATPEPSASEKSKLLFCDSERSTWMHIHI